MDSNHLLALAVSFCASVFLLFLLKPVAVHIGLLDTPNHRKHHDGAIPLIGGIAIFIAITLAMLSLNIPLTEYRGFFAAALILMIVGVLDDLHELSTTARFIAQITAALIMALGSGIELFNLGHLLFADSLLSLGWLALPFTVFATVGVINALNMIDGIDGLAGSVSLVSVISLGIITYTAGDMHSTTILGIIAAALVGFLLFNLRPGNRQALVFLGDAGSMLLGFVLVWFFIKFSQNANRYFAPVTALWLFAVPLLDTITTMIRRIKKGQSPFAPDRGHFHHLLQKAGYTPKQTVLIIQLFAIVTAGIGLTGHFYQIAESTLFDLFLVLFFLYLYINMHAWKTMRMLKNSVLTPETADQKSSA